MAKEKPPRKRLIAPDSDDEASAEAEGAPAEATKEPEEGEDPAAEEEVPEGEVDLKSVAARLRTEIAAPDDDTPVAPETFAPILEALGELKTADPLANPRLAEKAAKAKVLDALFALLEDAPRAIPPKKAPTKASTGSNADAEGDVGGTRTARKEDEADEDPDEDPPPPTEAERRAARVEAHRRAKYDALALPATRALAHLCGSHAAFRNDVGTQVVRVGTVFAALRPGRLSPAPSSDAAPAEPPRREGPRTPTPKVARQKVAHPLLELADRLRRRRTAYARRRFACSRPSRVGVDRRRRAGGAPRRRARRGASLGAPGREQPR